MSIKLTIRRLSNGWRESMEMIRVYVYVMSDPYETQFGVIRSSSVEFMFFRLRVQICD